MAGRLDREPFGDDEDNPFAAPELPDDPDPDWLTTTGRDLTAEERLWTEIAHFHDVVNLQDALLGRTDASLLSALSMYLDRRERADAPDELAAIIEESQATIRRLLLSNPLTLPLPGLPRVSGEAKAFAQEIRESLEAFRSRWPVYRTLVVPAMLTFLVIPPEQGKDLDNIARIALPIAHEVLKPHLLAPWYQSDRLTPEKAEALGRLKSVNARSVCAYQVIELPRSG